MYFKSLFCCIWVIHNNGNQLQSLIIILPEFCDDEGEGFEYSCNKYVSISAFFQKVSYCHCIGPKKSFTWTRMMVHYVWILTNKQNEFGMHHMCKLSQICPKYLHFINPFLLRNNLYIWLNHKLSESAILLNLRSKESNTKK